MKYSVFVFSVLFSWALFAKGKAGKKPIVAFVGDSITAGYGVTLKTAYPAVLDELLTKANRPVELINSSVSGSLSSSTLSRVKFLVGRRPVDVLVLAIGGNDARKATPAESIKSSLESVMKFAKQKKVTVLLVGMKIFSNLGEQYQKEFEGLYLQLNKAYKPVYMPFLLEDVALKPELNQKDGFHPNEDGHKVIAKNMLPYVLKALDQSKGEK
ncbi:MAG: arylesterase [Bdellovibrionaceae bacterium]|nr:arylesterase [Pseudobdellovibrionaceae bacterium]